MYCNCFFLLFIIQFCSAYRIFTQLHFLSNNILRQEQLDSILCPVSNFSKFNVVRNVLQVLFLIFTLFISIQTFTSDAVPCHLIFCSSTSAFSFCRLAIVLSIQPLVFQGFGINSKVATPEKQALLFSI